MLVDRPFAVIWSYPSRGSCFTNLLSNKPPKDNPAPLELGAVLRSIDMIGTVLADRELDGVPLATRSVAVQCTLSLSRFPELDMSQTHVWSTKTSQVLTGKLLEEATKNPESLVRKFMELEEKVRDQERQEVRAKVQAEKEFKQLQEKLDKVGQRGLTNPVGDVK